MLAPDSDYPMAALLSPPSNGNFPFIGSFYTNKFTFQGLRRYVISLYIENFRKNHSQVMPVIPRNEEIKKKDLQPGRGLNR